MRTLVSTALIFLIAIPVIGQSNIQDPPPPGTPIVSIRYITHDVFDLDEIDSFRWFYRLANKFHVVSRENMIRSILLFKTGDPLDSGRLEESERLLRQLGIFENVTISAISVAGGAEVIVETHDAWTIEVSVNYSIFGNRHSWSFELEDDNLLGLGKSVDFSVFYNVQRVSTSFEFFDPNIAGSRWRLNAAYQDFTDGQYEFVDVRYPFYSYNTDVAGGMIWNRYKLETWLWADGRRQVFGDEFQRIFHLWLGKLVAQDDRSCHRIFTGLFDTTVSFNNWQQAGSNVFPDPEDRRLTGVELGWERKTDRWVVISGFRGWKRQEDISLGPNYNLQTGFSLPLSSDIDHGTLVTASADSGFLHGRHYGWLNTSFSGRIDSGTIENTVTRLNAGYAFIGKQGIRMQISMDWGHDLDSNRQLTLGTETGLRGWDPDTFDGTSRALVNLEFRRQLTKEILHLFTFGAVVFADAGCTWNPRIGRDTHGWRFDSGVGLSMEITRSSAARMTRFEVGFPDDGGPPVFLLSTLSLF